MTYSYVALDVETANGKRTSICSIGLAKFRDGELVDTFYSLINPEEDFLPMNTAIHGITAEDVKDAPIFPQIRQQILDFIDGQIVVAHYAQFDFSVLKAAYEKYNLDFDDIRYICSYRLSKLAFPNMLNYKLNYLAVMMNIDLDHHNALSDATACGRLIGVMLKETVGSLDELLKKHNYVVSQLGHHTRSSGTYVYNTIYQPTEEEIAQMDASHPFYGLYFCFTGKLERMTRNEANKAAALVGAIPEKNVTRKTNVLVVGEQDWHLVGQDGLSSKMKKANDLLEKGQEIEILTEDDFIKLLG